MGRPKTLNISDIRIDGTQVRCQLSQETVNEYAEAMQAGDKFPPVEVMHDGSTFWLWNGFHRVFAAKAAGRTTIEAFSTDGTQADARWAALGANRKNGLRLTTADKAKAIRIALELKPEASDSQIAQQIGCDHKTVGKYRAEMQTTGEIPKSTDRQGRDGRTIDTTNIGTKPKPAAPEVLTTDDLPSDDEPEADELPAEELVESEVVTDKVGKPIPSDDIAEAFRRAGDLAELASDISGVKKAVCDAIEAADPLYVCISKSAFQADADNMRRHITSAAPYAVCCYCGGDGCKACNSLGWLNKLAYEAAPGELKK